MVIKIYAPAPSSSSAVLYNERKVAEGKASVIFSSRISDPANAMKTFSVYENGSLRTEKMSFHASVNPGPADKLSDTQVAEVVRQLMEKMGYGNQPYILYKHWDTDRVHYHLVSVRVDENGRKIPDFQERKRSQQAMKELSEKYDFEIGKGKAQENNTAEKQTNPYQGFDLNAGDYSGQIERIADLAMTYYFKKPEQFDLIMESLGVQVIHQVDGSHAYIGLDPKTHKPVTSPIQDSGIRFPTADAIQRQANKSRGLYKTREKQKVANAVRLALSPKKGIKTETHTLRYLAKWGIYTKFSKTAEGRIFGVTFVDHQNKCVFKASDLPGVTASQFEAARADIWAKNTAGGSAFRKDGAEKEERHEKDSADTRMDAAEISAEVAGIAISAFGNEKSRRNEDEEEMEKGRSL